MGLAKTFLAMAIAIVFCVFFAYGVYVVYEPPVDRYTPNPCYEQFECYQYTEHCYPKEPAERPLNPEKSRSCYDQAISSPEYHSCMDKQELCEENWRMEQGKWKHARNSFYVLFLISITAIIGGVFLKSSYEGIGSGVMGGGVLLILWSLIYTAEYWITWDKYVKLAALGIVLALLIYLGYKKVESRMAPTKKSRRRK